MDFISLFEKRTISAISKALLLEIDLFPFINSDIAAEVRPNFAEIL